MGEEVTVTSKLTKLRCRACGAFGVTIAERSNGRNTIDCDACGAHQEYTSLVDGETGRRAFRLYRKD